MVLAKEEFCVILEKGANGSSRSSSEKGDDWVVEARAIVYNKAANQILKKNLGRWTSSSTRGFGIKKDCFLCGIAIKNWEKEQKSKEKEKVRSWKRKRRSTEELKTKLLKQLKRLELVMNWWFTEITRRLEFKMIVGHNMLYTMN